MVENSIPQQTLQDDEINLLDYWRVLVKRKRLIVLIVSAVVVSSIIYSLLLPLIYASTATILPPQQEGGSIMSQLPGAIGGLAGNFLQIKSPADLWVGILKSQTIMDAMITRFDLMEIFEAKTWQDAIYTLNGMVKTSKSKEGIIAITVEDRDPEMAAAMANAFVEELDSINKGIVMTSGRRMRIFVEERLEEVKKELTRVEDSVKAFQEENRAVKLDAQSAAVIGSIGSIKGLLMAKEVELQTMLSFATPTNPQVEILKTQVKGLKERMKELEEGKPGSSNPHQKDIFIPTIRMPDLSLQYTRLIREAKTQQTLYELLTQQYEIARIQEAKDSPTVQVLDVAKVSENRVKPERRLIVMLSTFTAIFFAVFLAFFLEYIERIRKEQPRPQ